MHTAVIINWLIRSLNKLFGPIAQPTVRVRVRVRVRFRIGLGLGLRLGLGLELELGLWHDKFSNDHCNSSPVLT